MTCVCVKGEEIKKDTRCIHTGAETLEEAAIRGSPRGDEYWIWGAVVGHRHFTVCLHMYLNQNLK